MITTAKLIFTISALFFLTSCLGVIKPIDGAFGVGLGEIANIENMTKLDEFSAEPCYAFTPNKPFNKIQKYCIKITPKTNRVYSIEGKSSFDSYSECSDAEKVISELIQKKYGRGEELFQVLDSGEIISATRLFRGDSSIVVMSYHTKGKYSSHDLTVSYSDKSLEKLSKRESTEKLMHGVDGSQF